MFNNSNSGISVNSVDPSIISDAVYRSDLPETLRSAVEKYFSTVSVRQESVILNECINILNQRNSSGLRSNEVFNYITKLHNSNSRKDLAVFYSKIMVSIGAIVLGTNNWSGNTSVFASAVKIGSNVYAAKLYKDANMDISTLLNRDEINELVQLKQIIDSSLTTNQNTSFGNQSSFTANINSGSSFNMNHSNNVAGNSDNISILPKTTGFVEATVFGNSDKWTHQTANSTEVFGSSPKNNVQTKQEPISNQTTSINTKTFTPTTTGALTAMTNEWDALSTSIERSEYKKSVDSDELKEQPEASKVVRPFLNIGSDDDSLLTIREATRVCILNREMQNQIVSIKTLVGEDIVLTEDGAANMRSICTYIDKNDSIIALEDDQRYGRNTFPYVVRAIGKIDDSFVREAMFSYLESAINNNIIIRAGISSMVADISTVSAKLTKSLIKTIRQESFTADNSEREIYLTAISQIESSICRDVLGKFTVFNRGGNSDTPVIVLAKSVLVIDVPLTLSELGLNFKEPLVANRITKNSARDLWNIIDNCIEEDEIRPDELSIYTVDGHYVTGYSSVFCQDNSIIDLFDLSEVAHYSKM